MSGKRWRELDNRQRSALLVAAVVQVSLLLAALLDIRRRSDTEINGSRRMWTALAFINWIGPIAYFWKGRVRG